MQKVFIPGSKWLYFKIYTGHKSADTILVNSISHIINTLWKEELIDGFFFIRYSDPKFHIRFRMHTDNVLNYGKIYELLEQTLMPCVENGLISDIQCNTYIRELNRYGDIHINEVEKIFCVDSKAIIDLIRATRESESPEDDRWQLSILLIDDTLSAFGYDTAKKMNLLKQMSDDYKKEFGFTSHAFMKQQDDKYRSKRKIIELSMNDCNQELKKYEALRTTRKEEITKIANQITYTKKSISELLYSINHMTMNRLFRSKNRLFEMVIYDFMQRYYDSLLAKAKLQKVENK